MLIQWTLKRLSERLLCLNPVSRHAVESPAPPWVSSRHPTGTWLRSFSVFAQISISSAALLDFHHFLLSACKKSVYSPYATLGRDYIERIVLRAWSHPWLPSCPASLPWKRNFKVAAANTADWLCATPSSSASPRLHSHGFVGQPVGARAARGCCPV